VVGNGRSLEPWQLDRIAENGDISFAVNRIQLIYDKTDWRPTYWFLLDMGSSKSYSYDLRFHLSQAYPCFVRIDILTRWLGEWAGTHTPKEVAEMLRNANTLNNSWGGSMGGAVKKALAWGYNPIYQIGCEGNLSMRPFHFDEQYREHNYDEIDDAWVLAKNELLDEVAIELHRSCKKRGVSILNASVGGTEIKGIPETDFERLFDE
jgi:hypothetical protein